MNKTKILSILAIVAVFSLTLVPFASADSTTGDWDIATYPYYAKGDSPQTNTEGTALHEYGNIGTIDDTGGVEFFIQFTELVGERYEWWWSQGVKRLYVDLELKNGANETVTGRLYFAHEQGIILQTSQIKYGENYTDPNWGLNVNPWQFNEQNQYGIKLIRMGDQVLTSYRLESTSGGHPLDLGWGFNETLDAPSGASFWDGNVVANLYLAHEGNGRVNATIFNFQAYQSGLAGFQTLDLNDKPTDIWGMFRGLYNILVAVWGVITSVWGLIIDVFFMLVPFLPFIAIMYALDVVGTSIATGSFTPIGKLAQTLWDYLNAVVEWIVGVVQAVGSYLPW